MSIPQRNARPRSCLALAQLFTNGSSERLSVAQIPDAQEQSKEQSCTYKGVSSSCVRNPQRQSKRNGRCCAVAKELPPHTKLIKVPKLAVMGMTHYIRPLPDARCQPSIAPSCKGRLLRTTRLRLGPPFCQKNRTANVKAIGHHNISAWFGRSNHLGSQGGKPKRHGR